LLQAIAELPDEARGFAAAGLSRGSARTGAEFNFTSSALHLGFRARSGLSLRSDNQEPRDLPGRRLSGRRGQKWGTTSL